MVRARFLNDVTVIDVTSTSEVKRVKLNLQEDHNTLIHRDLPDQHPINAITGLQEALDTIPDDYVSDAELESALLEKQDTLTAGANIQINGDVISATDTTYTAGSGIDITNGVISNTQTSAEWGNITGTLSAQTDLWNILNAKANVADIPTATSDLTNDSGFITLAALTPYATQAWVEDKGYITSSALTPYVLSSSLATVATSGAYSDLSGTPTIPTDTSDLTNGAGYITSSALSGYAVDSAVVHKTGVETITGAKTISGTSFKVTNEEQFKLLTYDTRIDRGVAPSAWTGMFPYLLIGKNNKRLSGLYCSYAQDMRNQISLIAYKGTSTDASDYSIAQIDVGYDGSTRAYAKAPTPFENTTTSNQIDTVGARNTAIANKQDTLVSGTNIKTINSTTVLGSGNFALADQSLSNLDSTGQMIVDSANGTISNCILEIPQNIKLTLENNVLTVKSGSILTDSGLTYQTITLTSDKTTTISTSSNNRWLIFATRSGVLAPVVASACVSGETDSKAEQPIHIWFDTTNKEVLYYGSDGTTGSHRTYPLCVIDVIDRVASFAKDSNGNDMIFNGAGFIGHHAFVYPNVKALIPNGLNADGSMKSIEINNNALSIIELSSAKCIFLTRNTSISNDNGYYEVDTKEDIGNVWSAIYYVKKENQSYIHQSTNSIFPRTPLVFYSYTGGVLTDFTIRQPVRTATTEMLDKKQDTLTAGTGIDITNNVISADIATSVSSASTNSQSVGAKLFYDTVGDIETLLSQV